MGERVRLRALIAYDGAGFHGFAEQVDMRTVGGELVSALTRVFGEVDDFTCAGRTDTGVHGLGQVVHFDVSADRVARHPLDRVQVAINKQIAPAIVVRSLEIAAPDFHARFSATGRRYRYTVLNRALPDPFSAHIAWWVAEALDLDAMNAAGALVVGEHDFSTFCRRPKGVEEVSLTRRIRSVRWQRNVDFVVLDIEANAFCHQMVRALTGMMVDIGRGKRAVDDMRVALEALDRSAAAPLAPPQGLCLQEVLYD